MAVDHEVKSVEHNEFLCRQVVRIAVMLLMCHPTYQGVFMCGRRGSFFDVFDEWNNEFEYTGVDNMDDMMQSSNNLTCSCTSLLHPSGTCFIYKPRTHVNFGSAARNDSVEPAIVDAASRNEAVPNTNL